MYIKSTLILIFFITYWFFFDTYDWVISYLIGPVNLNYHINGLPRIDNICKVDERTLQIFNTNIWYFRRRFGQSRIWWPLWRWKGCSSPTSSSRFESYASGGHRNSCLGRQGYCLWYWWPVYQGKYQIWYHDPLLIKNCSWILTIYNDRIG